MFDYFAIIILNNKNIIMEEKMENNLSKAYVEILEILSYMEQKYVDMIPNKS